MEKGKDGSKLVVAVIESDSRKAEGIAYRIADYLMCRKLECFDLFTLSTRQKFAEVASGGNEHIDIVVANWPASKLRGDNLLSILKNESPETSVVLLNPDNSLSVPGSFSNLAGFVAQHTDQDFFRAMDRAIRLLPEQEQVEREVAYG